MGKERFAYRVTKNGKVFVYRHGKQGKREIVLKGARARSTGNFKCGNERPVR